MKTGSANNISALFSNNLRHLTKSTSIMEFLPLKMKDSSSLCKLDSLSIIEICSSAFLSPTSINKAGVLAITDVCCHFARLGF